MKPRGVRRVALTLWSVLVLSIGGCGSDDLRAGSKIVIFLDTGNTGRSVMSEEVAKQFLAEKGWTDIIPLGRGVKVNPANIVPEKHAVELLTSRGIDVSAHVATQLTPDEARQATVILPVSFKNLGQVITFEPTTRDKSFLLSDYAVGKQEDIEDAWGKDLPAYQAALAQIDEYVPAALTKIHEAR